MIKIAPCRRVSVPMALLMTAAGLLLLTTDLRSVTPLRILWSNTTTLPPRANSSTLAGTDIYAMTNQNKQMYAYINAEANKFHTTPSVVPTEQLKSIDSNQQTRNSSNMRPVTTFINDKDYIVIKPLRGNEASNKLMVSSNSSGLQLISEDKSFPTTPRVKRSTQRMYTHESGVHVDPPTEVLLEPDFDTELQALLENMAKQNHSKPENIQTVNEVWQVVKGLEFYLYSAFYDDRPTLNRTYVRIITIQEVNDKAQNDTFCLLWYRQGQTLLTHGKKLKIGVRYPRHNKYFDPSLISCMLPQNSTDIPMHVSLLTRTHTIPTTLVRVHVPEKPGKPFDFGICVSVTYWRHDPARVVEWLELHRKWGVQEVTVYNNSLATDTVAVLQYYVKQGFVDLRQGPSCMNDTGETTILMNMSPVINDCMYRNMYRYKKIVCVDFDELIVPRNRDNYHAMIEYIDATQPRTHPYKTYMFRNVYFWFDFGPMYEEPKFLVTTRYLKRVNPSEYGVSVKCITDPMICEGLQNHVCWHVIRGYRRGKWLLEADPSVGMNQHYKKCHLPTAADCAAAMRDNETIDRTMMRFDKEMEYRVSQVLMELHLLPTPTFNP